MMKMPTFSHLLQKMYEPLLLNLKILETHFKNILQRYLPYIKKSMDTTVVRSIRSAKQTILVQYEAYVSERIAGTKRLVTDIIKKNNLPLI